MYRLFNFKTYDLFNEQSNNLLFTHNELVSVKIRTIVVLV